MLGIIVQLAISWLIIWLIEKQTLSVLGLFPTKNRLLQFFLFFFITSLCCALGFLLRMYVGKQHWIINPVLTNDLILSGVWWNIKSVMFEELIFRGVFIYILIKRLGPLKGIIISAIAFGVYHWFSFGIIGNVTQMIIIFIITGVMGLLLAFGYYKTMSLYVPVAIHLGWNVTQNFIFSGGPMGNQLLIPVNESSFRTDSYLIFFYVMIMPVMLMLIINYLLLKKQRQITIQTRGAVVDTELNFNKDLS